MDNHHFQEANHQTKWAMFNSYVNVLQATQDCMVQNWRNCQSYPIFGVPLVLPKWAVLKILCGSFRACCYVEIAMMDQNNNKNYNDHYCILLIINNYLRYYIMTEKQKKKVVLVIQLIISLLSLISHQYPSSYLPAAELVLRCFEDIWSSWPAGRAQGRSARFK